MFFFLVFETKSNDSLEGQNINLKILDIKSTVNENEGIKIMDIMKEDVEHLLRDVRKGKKLYECDRCDHRFTEKDNLKSEAFVINLV